jgi:hypothetical protein
MLMAIATAKLVRNLWRTGFRLPMWAFPLAVLATSLLFFVGCANSPFIGQSIVGSYKPSNVYLEEASLPPNVKRVAILPLTTLNDEAAMDAGREALWPALLGELGRARQFELVPVNADELRSITGRSAWTGEEKLPLDFFEKLRERLGVDAILFSQLTEYRAYQPLAIGWRLKLLEAEEPRTLWSVDEFFDARVPEVAAAARRHAERHPDTQSSLHDPQGVLISPRRFGQYAAFAVVETLPGRRPGGAP